MSAARVQVATAHCSVFGSVVQDVVGTLFRPGRHTLQSLSRALSKGAMVKESLIVLLQHNLIKATETEDGTVFYDVNVQDLLWRGRIPRYLQVVERKFDQLGAEIIEFLFSHGRARLVRWFVSEVSLFSSWESVALLIVTHPSWVAWRRQPVRSRPSEEIHGATRCALGRSHDRVLFRRRSIPDHRGRFVLSPSRVQGAVSVRCRC
eukprot:m.92792 g.92792  ORF g.92792 m.92792 type:complete len:206 (+) comp51176_c0_seq4:26-643(+)